MFVNSEQVERKALRQGDIITNIHLLGVINLKSIQYSTTLPAADNYTNWTIPATPKFGDAMVLSHSCEIAVENRLKLTSVILAPLRDIDTATKPEQVEELIQSNLIDQEKPRASFLKYFYLPPHPNLRYSKGAIVDFSKCFSVRKQCYEILLKKKVAQLAADAVSSLGLKLALYFHRKGVPCVTSH
jgi:hypothetical protein